MKRRDQILKKKFESMDLRKQVIELCGDFDLAMTMAKEKVENDKKRTSSHFSKKY